MCSIYHGAVIYVSDRLGGEFLSLFFGFLCLTRARRHDPRSGSKTFRRKKENVFHQQRERGSPVYDLDLYHSRIVQQRLYRKKNAKQKRRRRRRVGPIDPSTPPNGGEPLHADDVPACGVFHLMKQSAKNTKKKRERGKIERKPSPHPAQSDCFLIPSSSARDHVILSYTTLWGSLRVDGVCVLYLILFQSSSRRCTAVKLYQKNIGSEKFNFIFSQHQFPIVWRDVADGHFPGL